MAGRISEMTAAAAALLTQWFEVSEDIGGSPATKRVSNQMVQDLILASVPQAVRYAFDDTTNATGISSGQIRFNNATLGSVTEMYIHDTDSQGMRWGLKAMNDLKVGDFFQIYKLDGSSNYFQLTVTSVTDASGYTTVGVSAADATGSFTDGDDLSVLLFSLENRLFAPDTGGGVVSSSNELTPRTDRAVTIVSTLTEDTEVQTPIAIGTSKSYSLFIKNTGGQAITFASGWDFGGGTAPTPTATANGIDWYVFHYNDFLTTWVLGAALQDIKGA